jgi:hypothetical protein
MKSAVAQWPRYAEQAGVARKPIKEIADKVKLQ